MCYRTEIYRQERGTYLNSPSLGENSHGGGARPEPWMAPSVVRISGEEH